MSKRDEYVEKFKVKLDEWNADLNKLEAKTEHAKENLKETYHEEIDAVRQQRDNIKDRLKELAGSSESAWEELKVGADEAWKKLSEAIDRARSKF
jgi:DNA repair ATPase RecN